MKQIIVVLLLIVYCSLKAQEKMDTICGTLPPDSLQSMHLAYFGNNALIDSILQEVGYAEWLDSVLTIENEGRTHTRTNSDGYLFNIPVTIWDYHDNDG